MFGDPYDNPMAWNECTLQDVLVGKPSNGFFAKPADYSEDGNAGIVCVGDVVNRKYSNVENLRRANADDKQLSKFKVKYGDILFCRSSLVKEGIAKASIIPDNCPENTLFECHVIRLPLNIEKVIPEYVQAFTTLEYFRTQMMDKSKTATMTTIGQKDVVSGKIFIPSMELQKKFVKFTDQNDKSKFTGFKSQFIEMFGDPVDNPMGWPMRKLSDVAKVDGTMTKEYEKYADYPHIGIDSIEKNTGILSGYRTVQEDNVISPKYYFGPQHILYSKIRPALNKVALPDFEGLCSADCYPLLVNGLCDRKFLAHVMRSDYFLDHVLSYSGRSQMPKVNRKQLEGFSFPCPPIDLQEKFTALIDQSDKSKFELKQAIEGVDLLIKSMVQQELS